jgi:hypothetical protein
MEEQAIDLTDLDTWLTRIMRETKTGIHIDSRNREWFLQVTLWRFQIRFFRRRYSDAIRDSLGWNRWTGLSVHYRLKQTEKRLRTARSLKQLIKSKHWDWYA